MGEIKMLLHLLYVQGSKNKKKIIPIVFFLCLGCASIGISNIILACVALETESLSLNLGSATHWLYDLG